MKYVLGILLIILAVFLALLLICAIILAWSIGLGWVMTQFLPFTWFETSLLALVASAGMVTVIFKIAQGLVNTIGSDLGNDEWEDEEEDEYAIPATRFYKAAADQTKEAWLRFESANAIYDELEEETRLKDQLGERRLQELAIRLADFSVQALKSGSKRKQKGHLTKTALRQQISSADQKPYDDETLTLTVTAVNDQLDYYPIRSYQEWDEPCELFD